jgi:hypothetical protein
MVNLRFGGIGALWCRHSNIERTSASVSFRDGLLHAMVRLMSRCEMVIVADSTLCWADELLTIQSYEHGIQRGNSAWSSRFWTDLAWSQGRAPTKSYISRKINERGPQGSAHAKDPLPDVRTTSGESTLPISDDESIRRWWKKKPVILPAVDLVVR